MATQKENAAKSGKTQAETQKGPIRTLTQQQGTQKRFPNVQNHKTILLRQKFTQKTTTTNANSTLQEYVEH